jgi:HD-GYP domain-containing protein (c-di-GMP phosphodiesterase class II)
MSTDFGNATLASEPAGSAAWAEDQAVAAAEVARTLRQGLGVELTVVDGETGDVLHVGQDQLAWNVERWCELCRAVAARQTAEIIEEADPLLVLALTCDAAGADAAALPASANWVALGVFITSNHLSAAELAGAADWLRVDGQLLARWARRQTPVAAATLQRLATLVLSQRTSQRRVQELEADVGKLSQHLCNTYEEISLIYQLTDNLTLSRREDDLARKALQWLADLLPAQGLALQRVSPRGSRSSSQSFLTHGACPLDGDAFSDLIDALGLNDSRRVLVANRPVTLQASWPQPEVRELLVVPLCEGETFFGWLAAVNHSCAGEFGSVEASLLGSVSAILGVHHGNTSLYREQAELMCDMVQALTSAIDAKDPYTCGHSDRVARVAVRLARELGCDQKTAETLYLSGLLHDVGKIGIDDHVLRKPARLTPDEYEHIKLHPQLGYNILSGIKHLEPVLPVVLHHHEAWDGSGYPRGLAGDDIPYLARITAVADAFDAMGSDRVYRKGMSDERLDAIIRQGAGQQWDAAVVDAFFRVRDEIRDISRRERDADVPELVNLFLP